MYMLHTGFRVITCADEIRVDQIQEVLSWVDLQWHFVPDCAKVSTCFQWRPKIARLAGGKETQPIKKFERRR